MTQQPDQAGAKAPEAIPAAGVAIGAGDVALADPTQVRRPWRSTARTIFQAAVGLASLAPMIAAEVYDSSADYPAAVVQILAVSAAVTRFMAKPRVERILRRRLPFLAAAPRPKMREITR